MRQYLEHAVLAVRLGSVVFVHGGIHPEAIGVVPGRGAISLDCPCELRSPWIARARCDLP